MPAPPHGPSAVIPGARSKYPLQVPLNISYIGLGNMGLPIARNILRYIRYHRHRPLTVWNRSKEKYAQVPEAEGVSQVEDILDGSPLRVVFTSFANDAAVKEVYATLFRNIGEGHVIFVDQSTLHPDTSIQLEGEALKVGAVYLACPVMGQPPAAAEGKLVCMVAGNLDAIEYVKPIFDYISREVIVIGLKVADASYSKLLINMMLYESIQAFSEVYALADGIGFPVDKLHDAFIKYISTVLPAPPLVDYSNRISKGLFDGSNGFKIDGGIKDVSLMLSLRDKLKSQMPLPTLERVLANLQQAKGLPEGGGAAMSVEALTVITRVNGGLSPFQRGQ